VIKELSRESCGAGKIKTVPYKFLYTGELVSGYVITLGEEFFKKKKDYG
jgi:hypothetical protein